MSFDRSAPRRAAPTPKGWSHQTELSARRGQKIAIDIANYDQELVGRLVEADAFTVKVAHGNEEPTTYFKHSIARYRFLAE